MAFNEEFLRELQYRTDIVDVISSYVTLKGTGNTSKGLCPFHNEKTPSFTVYHDTQSYYCFGCGAGGNAITFIKNIENVDYIDAVKILAQRAGLEMPETGFDNNLAKTRRKILEINKEAAKFFHSYMIGPEGKVGLNYFLNRGLNIKTITKYGLGYAPDKWDALLKHLKDKGYYLSDIEQAGLIKKNKNGGYYDIFRNRVMTPIIDVRGNVIAFGGRVLDDSKPKYVNTSDTLVYKKTNELFGLNLAKDSGLDTLILCEGYMDVITMHQAGFKNAVAGCGTALTNEQVNLISRYAKNVILGYDGDEAGQKALNKAIELFSQTDVKVKIPSFIGGKDPDEIIKTQGIERFKAMLEGTSNEIEYKLLNARKKYNLNATQGKVDFLNEAVKILARTSPIEQDLYASRLAEELLLDKNSIKIQLNDYIKKTKRRNEAKKYNNIIDKSVQELNKESYNENMSIKAIKAQDRLIGLLYLYPDCYKLCDEFDVDLIADGFWKKIFNIILDRIKNGMDNDMVYFSEVLTNDEMGRLSGIIARTTNSANPKKEFLDCLSTIAEEGKSKEALNVDNLSDDDFRNLFNKTTNK